MENQQNSSDQSTPEQQDQQADWQKPELIVEDVEAATQGGTIGDLVNPDDAFYT